MNQFSDAIKSGVDSARQAEINKKEITAAIKELGAAIEEFTGGAVTIGMMSVPAPPDETDPLRSITATALALSALGGGRKIDIISARRTSPPNKSAQLAQIDIPTSGYPCTLSFDGRKYACHDQVSFVDTLKNMVSGAAAGKALLGLQAGGD